jgi:hypothetical protein
MKLYWTSYSAYEPGWIIAEIDSPGKDDVALLSNVIYNTGTFEDYEVGTEAEVSDDEIVDEHGVVVFVFEEMGS